MEWGLTVVSTRKSFGDVLGLLCRKVGRVPIDSFVDTIVEIIVHNLFQMDGLTQTIPLLTNLSTQPKSQSQQLSLSNVVHNQTEQTVVPEEPIPVLIKNWMTNRMERFY